MLEAYNHLAVNYRDWRGRVAELFEFGQPGFINGCVPLSTRRRRISQELVEGGLDPKTSWGKMMA